MSGSISYLYYANRVFQLPLAIFAIATSIALFPMVAKAIKNGEFSGVRKLPKPYRITSYNVCYTKLLRIPLKAPAAF